MLKCTIQDCTILYYAMLYCTVLYCAIYFGIGYRILSSTIHFYTSHCVAILSCTLLCQPIYTILYTMLYTILHTILYTIMSTILYCTVVFHSHSGSANGSTEVRGIKHCCAILRSAFSGTGPTVVYLLHTLVA